MRGRSVMTLLPKGTAGAPMVATLLTKLDQLLEGKTEDADGVVEVDFDDLLDPCNDVWTLFMTMMLLPEGFAVLCGRSPEGEVLEDVAFLEEAERREGGGTANRIRAFYKVNTRLLAAEPDMANAA